MPSDIAVYEHYDSMNQVAELMLQGNNPTAIAKKLGMKRVDVVQYIDEWQRLARNSNQIQERAKDAVSGADQHYSMIIKRLWDNVEQADNSGELKIAQTGLSAIANVEEKRINMLQKAGLLDNQDLAQQIAETERKHKILMDVLRDIAGQHPVVREQIIRALNKVQDGGGSIVVGETVNG